MNTENDKNRVVIFDTTLRDGEQCPGATMNLHEKLEVAKQLAAGDVTVLKYADGRGTASMLYSYVQCSIWRRWGPACWPKRPASRPT